MEPKDVEKFLGKEVVWTANGDKLAEIVSYDKGWITIQVDEDQHKVRAKDIMLTTGNEDLVENEEGDLEARPMDPSSDGSEESLAPVGTFSVGDDIDCESCGHTFKATREESIQCPNCGHWMMVRLRPDLSHYVKGMGITPSGRDTLDIDDTVANMVRGCTLEDLYSKVCVELKQMDRKAWFSKAMDKNFRDSGLTCVEFLQDRYEGLNDGMQHMNMRNLLRGAIQRQREIDLMKEVKKDK